MEDKSMSKRSTDVERQIPEEQGIGALMRQVEDLGAHPHLTNAMEHLLEARRMIGKWHDMGRPGAYKKGS